MSEADRLPSTAGSLAKDGVHAWRSVVGDEAEFDDARLANY